MIVKRGMEMAWEYMQLTAPIMSTDERHRVGAEKFGKVKIEQSTL